MRAPVERRAACRRGACVGFALLAATLPFLADPVFSDPALSDPVLSSDEESGATYARVRYLEGGLTLERASLGEAVEGSLNSPIASGDAVWTRGGRAEIELADAAVIWMDDDTRIEFRTLADAGNRYERTDLVAVQKGTIRVEAGRVGESDGAFQVDTQAGSIYLLSPGSFRIEVDGDATTLASYGGVAEFSGDGGSVLVRTAQRSRVTSGDSPEEPRRFNTGRADDFDLFHDRRASAYLDSGGSGDEPPQDVPEQVAPYVSELSAYGTWTTLPTYGVVWRPAYVGAWTPYYHGYWDWCPTGWVWVSYDPWGWAPYRYGRWDYASSFGWFWIPGRVWSGAWVSYAVGPSYIGWCPLNYWNRPVFYEPAFGAQASVPVARLDPRAWQFVPAARFGARGPMIAVTRIDRLPRNSDVVVTRVLPTADRLNALGRSDSSSSLIDEARRHRVVLPEARTAAGDPVSFRTLEIRRPQSPRVSPSQRATLPGVGVSSASRGVPRGASLGAPMTRTRGALPGIPDPTRSAGVGVRRSPAAPPRDLQPPQAAARPPVHDPAVGRLIQGVRPTPRALPAQPAGPPAQASQGASQPSSLESRPASPQVNRANPQMSRKPQPPNKPVPGAADHPDGKDPDGKGSDKGRERGRGRVSR